MFKLPSITQQGIFNRASSTLAAYTAVASLIIVQAAQAQASGLIPCDGNDCNLNSVMQLINNLINFFFTTLLIPIFVIMVMYLGYTYLTAGGNSGQHAKLRSMAKHMFLGLLLILCAFLIVKTIFSVLGVSDSLNFFG